MGRFFIGNGEKWDMDLNGPKKKSLTPNPSPKEMGVIRLEGA